jgi:hypothetical protein
MPMSIADHAPQEQAIRAEAASRHDYSNGEGRGDEIAGDGNQADHRVPTEADVG